MRVEFHHGQHILCGGIIPKDEVKTGQVWQGSRGIVVTVVSSGDWVKYKWKVGEKTYYHEKDNFSFQCRYCLVLKGNQLPEFVQHEQRLEFQK